jgi:hypothetical protein
VNNQFRRFCFHILDSDLNNCSLLYEFIALSSFGIFVSVDFDVGAWIFVDRRCFRLF